MRDNTFSLEDTTISDILKTFEDYYSSKEFARAHEVLIKHKNDIPEGSWHYNMGTVLVKMDELAEARYHFLMAETKGLKAEELGQNLEIVNERLEVSKLEKPLESTDYLIKGALIASEGILTTISFLFCAISIWIIRKNQQSLKFLALLPFVLVPLLLNWWIHTWQKAVVIEPQAIMDGPSGIFLQKQEIPNGVFVVLKGEGDWLEVVYPSRYSGWIKNKGLRVLE